MVGKSSSIRRFTSMFYNPIIYHFKPPFIDPCNDFLYTWKNSLPTKDNNVVFWDRSYLGRITYDLEEGLITEKEYCDRKDVIDDFEWELNKEFTVIKFYLKANKEKIIKTMNKRKKWCPNRISKNDELVLDKYSNLIELFKNATCDSLYPWIEIDMNSRTLGRISMFNIIKNKLNTQNL